MSNFRAPEKFVGLHCHTGGSAFDGLGSPQQHIDFVLKNGMDAWALTDHGHANGFALSYLYAQKLKKAGKQFKLIPGSEMYIHPDLEQWKRDKEREAQLALDKKEAKRQAAQARERVKTEIDRVTDQNDETEDVETSNALTVENEEETKSGKTFKPVNRRHHIVVLPKTSGALMKIFGLISRGYLEGFYRFPRIDLRWLREAARDRDIIVSSACLGGFLSYETLGSLRGVSFERMDPGLLDDPSVMEDVMRRLGNAYDQYVDAVGDGNLYLELQFNRLPAQHVVNRALLEFARRNSLQRQLLVTSDSHYPNPDAWYYREMYKKLGYLNYADYGPDSLPKSRAELKAELYPKNAVQVWEEATAAFAEHPFYAENVELVRDAIERTHDVAHSVIGDIQYDTGYKYPTRIIPQGQTAFQVLVRMAKEGLRKRGLHEKQEYVDRLLHELRVIKKMDNAAYFVTLERALGLAREVCLLGVARGSSGGSLVAYVLYITDLDPIKYGCRFDRFLNEHRLGAPDIDVDVADRDKVLDELRKEFGFNNVIPISNVNLFKLKTLVKDISKFYGISFEEVNLATRTVEQDCRKATQEFGADKNLWVLTYEDAVSFVCAHGSEGKRLCTGCSPECTKPVSPTFKAFIDKYPHVGESITTLFKEQRSLGRHAGGVVLLDDAPNTMPLITNKGEPQTPWTEGVSVKTLEPLGVLKYDLLGLESMRFIESAIDKIIRKDGLVEIELDGRPHRLLRSQSVELTDGSWKSVAMLSTEDDVKTPVNVR